MPIENPGLLLNSQPEGSHLDSMNSTKLSLTCCMNFIIFTCYVLAQM